MYLLHEKYAKDPRHYVHAFLLIQQDMADLFSCVEPCETNRDTYSHRIHQLLMRSCVEIEANFKAIFLENKYNKCSKENSHLNIQDYRLINCSHRLSSYQVRVPGWSGEPKTWQPFEPWSEQDDEKKKLEWYTNYNLSKHDRQKYFKLANLDSLMNAFCGLNILISSQFMDEDYGPANKSIGLEGSYTYGGNDDMEPSIGGMLRIKFPDDWPEEDRYEFNWDEISAQDDPFDVFDYDKIL